MPGGPKRNAEHTGVQTAEPLKENSRMAWKEFVHHELWHDRGPTQSLSVGSLAKKNPSPGGVAQLVERVLYRA
jgi:hypothetical protein